MLSRHSKDLSGNLPGISVSTDYVTVLIMFVALPVISVCYLCDFLEVKADGCSGWPLSSWDRLSLWRITVYSLTPRNSALRPSGPPGGLWAVGTPSASVHSLCWDLCFPSWTLLPRTMEPLTSQSLGKWISSPCLVLSFAGGIFYFTNSSLHQNSV